MYAIRSYYAMIPDLINVTPIDWYELILEFDGFEIKSFEPSKADLYKDFKFLAYPNRLRGYSFDREKITRITSYNVCYTKLLRIREKHKQGKHLQG